MNFNPVVSLPLFYGTAFLIAVAGLLIGAALYRDFFQADPASKGYITPNELKVLIEQNFVSKEDHKTAVERASILQSQLDRTSRQLRHKTEVIEAVYTETANTMLNDVTGPRELDSPLRRKQKEEKKRSQPFKDAQKNGVIAYD